jgi:hypothetical protein
VLGRTACLSLVVAALAGCGNDTKRLSASCTRSSGRITRALAAAPGSVKLEDGTPLSDCVQAATGSADLQNVGAVFTEVGSRLARAAPRDRASALRLGYLVGAVERGAARTAGFQDELTFRMRTFLDNRAISGAERAALAQGRRAGRRAG